MSSYPMEAVKIHLKHAGGTKDYTGVLIASANGPALIVKRWGKVGAKGQFKVEQFDTTAKAETAWGKFLDERFKKGYGTDSKNLFDDIKSLDDLVRAVGRTTFPNIGSSNLKFIDPNADTTGMRDPEANRDEDGNFVGNVQRRVAVTKKMIENERAEKRREEAAKLANHPLYGRF